MAAYKEHYSGGEWRKCVADEGACRVHEGDSSDVVPHITADTKEELVVKRENATESIMAKEGYTTHNSVSKTPEESKPFEAPVIYDGKPEHRYDMKWFGSNYERTQRMSNTEVAKEIRGDIKKAVQDGYLPKNFKYSVRTHQGSININVQGPGRDRDKYTYGRDMDGFMTKRLKPEHREVVDRVQLIQDSYNQNSSDSMTDYFDVAFYGHTRYNDDGDMALENHERVLGRVRRFMNAEKKRGQTEDQIAQNPEFKRHLREFNEARYHYLKVRGEGNAAHQQIKEADYDTEVVDIDWHRVDAKAEDFARRTLEENNRHRAKRNLKSTDIPRFV